LKRGSGALQGAFVLIRRGGANFAKQTTIVGGRALENLPGAGPLAIEDAGVDCFEAERFQRRGGGVFLGGYFRHIKFSRFKRVKISIAPGFNRVLNARRWGKLFQQFSRRWKTVETVYDFTVDGYPA
jgi:hypothetical protein